MFCPPSSIFCVLETHRRIQVDGDTLAHAVPGEFDLTIDSCEQARPHHWSKFWRRLKMVQAKDGMPIKVPTIRPIELAETSQNAKPTVGADGERRLLNVDTSTGFGGLRIALDKSLVAFGASLDTVLYRSGVGKLTLEGELTLETADGNVNVAEDILLLKAQVAALVGRQ